MSLRLRFTREKLGSYENHSLERRARFLQSPSRPGKVCSAYAQVVERTSHGQNFKVGQSSGGSDDEILEKSGENGSRSRHLGVPLVRIAEKNGREQNFG